MNDQNKLLSRYKRHIPFYFYMRHLKNLLSPKEYEYLYIYQNLNKYDAYIDVGVNVGIYSYLFQRSRADVYAFEPNPYLYDYINHVLGRKIHIYNYALSSSKSEQILYVPEHELTSGRSSLHKNTTEKYSKSLIATKIEAVRFDEIINYRQYNNIFVKIDVEGHEYEVLQGCDNALKDNLSIDFMIEVEPGYNENWMEVFKYASKYGYMIYYYDGQRLKKIKIQSEDDLNLSQTLNGETRRVNNFFFIK